eukprot:7780912-Pyramimonas_sp.AAC.1
MPRGSASIREVGSTRRKGTPVEAGWGVLGASWRSRSPRGALLKRPWEPSERYWSPLGPSWSHPEASDGHRKRQGEKAQHVDCPK